jgi:4-amino-4-deoxy-L-arabinose transferase-like glycosyltransferase
MSSKSLSATLRPYAWLVVALLIGLLLRLPELGSRPMWYDEAFSVLFSSTGPKSMLYGTLTPVEGVAADVHPLLYYTILWGWMKIAGTSALAVRSLSVLIGLGIIVVGWRLALNLFNRRAADLSAVLLAISPFEIHYAQEARMYALLALLCLLTALFYQRGISSGRWRDWIGFGLFAGLSMYAHILAGGFLLSLGIAWLIWHRFRRAKQFLAGVGLAILMYAPWLVQLPSQMGKVGQAYWIERPGLLELVQTVLIFVTDLPLKDIFLPVGLFIALFMLGLLLWRTVWARRSQQPQSEQVLWVGFLALAPVLVIFAVSQFRPVFILRGLLPSVSFYILWLAWGLTAERRNRVVIWSGISAMILASVLGLYSRLDFHGFPYAPFDRIGEQVESQLEPGAIVLHSNKLSMLPLVYAAPQLDQRYMADISGSGSDTLALPTQEVLGLLAYDDIEAAVDGANRVYFVIFEREIMEYQSAGFDQHPYLAWLALHYEEAQIQTWGDLRVYVFQ